ncbi:MAG: hypothetical protein ACLQF0_01840, partial [Dissulfurispiraceae bacterium]
QLIAAFWLDWVMFILLPLVLMDAAPADTCPPVGSALGAGGCANAGTTMLKMIKDATEDRQRKRAVRISAK